MTAPRSIDRILTEQIGLWSLRQKEGQSSGPYRPIITISRSYGARGAELASMVGERLGFSVWDREIVHAIAKKRGGDERLLETLDEHRRSQVDETIRSLVLGTHANNATYFKSLMRVVRTISQHGSAVIVGRGANFAVNSERALRVRVDAPIEWRTAGLAHRFGWSLDKARREAVRMDAERDDFIHHHFKVDGSLPEYYDLVLNPEYLSLGQMAGLIEKAYEGRFSRVRTAIPSPI